METYRKAYNKYIRVVEITAGYGKLGDEFIRRAWKKYIEAYRSLPLEKRKSVILENLVISCAGNDKFLYECEPESFTRYFLETTDRI